MISAGCRSASLGVESTLFHSHTYSVRDSISIWILGYGHLQRPHPRLLYQHTFGVRPEAPSAPRGKVA